MLWEKRVGLFGSVYVILYMNLHKNSYEWCTSYFIFNKIIYQF